MCVACLYLVINLLSCVQSCYCIKLLACVIIMFLISNVAVTLCESIMIIVHVPQPDRDTVCVVNNICGDRDTYVHLCNNWFYVVVEVVFGSVCVYFVYSL